MRKKTCLLKLCVASLSCWLWWGMSSVPGPWGMKIDFHIRCAIFMCG